MKILMTKASLKKAAAACMAVAAVAILGGCRHQVTNTSTSGLGTVVCDATFQNIMDQEIDVFEYDHPNASIIPFYASEKECIDSLLDLNTKTIVIPRDLTSQEREYLKGKRKNVRSNRIAVDAVALIVNPANPVDMLDVDQVVDILTGKVTDWNQLGPNTTGEIQVVFDNEGSSTVAYMRDSVLRGEKFGENVYAQNSIPEVFDQVAKRKGAIGIIGVSWISADLRTRDMTREERIASLHENDTTVADFNTDIKVLAVRPMDSLRAYKPYQAYIYDGTYPFHRQIFMITTAAGGSLGSGFFAFVTGTIGQKIIQRTGILPGRMQPRMVNVTRQGETQ